MQGGGVRVDGSANFVNCNIFSNEASSGVRARILYPLDASSSAQLNSDVVRCFDTQAYGVGARS